MSQTATSGPSIGRCAASRPEGPPCPILLQWHSAIAGMSAAIPDDAPLTTNAAFNNILCAGEAWFNEVARLRKELAAAKEAKA